MATTSKKTTKQTSIKVRKGDVCECLNQTLVLVTNGRLKKIGDELAFQGKVISFSLLGHPKPSGTATDIFLADVKRVLTKKEYAEWCETEKREADAVRGDDAPEQPAKTAAKPKAKTKKKSDGKMSALDAAAKVLREADEPLGAKQMIEAMSAKKYWTSPGGKTPHATLYAAILREIQQKGDEARFRKVDRGQFELAR